MKSAILSLRHWIAASVVFVLIVPRALATTLLIESWQLELPGGWEQIANLRNDTARKFLIAGAHAANAPAAGAIEIPHAGKWRLWVRSKDFPNDRPGTRHFTVRLGGQKSQTIFGKHGRGELDGWAWEDGGIFELKAEPTLVVIGEESTPSARCDALLLTDNMSYKPEGVTWKLAKPAAKMAPLTFNEESVRGFIPQPLREVDAKPLATLQNDSSRLTFHSAKTASGSVIAMRAAVRNGASWVIVNDDAGAESYRILFRPRDSDPKIVSYRMNPTWDIGLSPAIEAHCGDASVRTRLGIATAPWSSAKCFPLRPTSARQRDANTVELTFPSTDAGQLKAVWHLPQQKTAAEIELDFTPKVPGYFSLGYHGPIAAPPEKTDFLLLPFMYQGRRFPEQPAMLLNTVTPTPLALVNRGGVSCALVAEPQDIPFEWPGSSNSRYALGLRNESGEVQPLIYSPVLGLSGSVSDGAPVRARFRLWIQRGDWYSAYRGVATEIFHLTDYRRPVNASLSDTALNLLDLMRNEKAAGWDARAKGPWNIESRNVVSQVSPLTYLSLYLLTGDEDFYKRFARPSLEFLISRPGPHFAAEREIGYSYYKHQPMRGPVPLFGASTWASAFAMTHGRSPVFGEFCLDENGAPRPTRANGHTQPFADSLALFRLTGERRWLDMAVASADKYIAANIATLPARDLGVMPFVNVSFVPDWEGLLHLYEATGEKRFLDAATEGARWLTTTLWTQPVIPDGDTTVNPGGVYDHSRHIWSWGDKRYRRGIYEGPDTDEYIGTPPPALPEHRVPAWQVSQVGLGLEQPSTYVHKGDHANILMSAWAPSLLRLARPAHDDAFRTAARNAVIGRFANYPGYYLDGFTDQCLRADYPIAGPDITSLYMHHVPPFAAFVIDYLFTDAEVRSEGAVTFPSVRQCGYVWFDSRLYGHAPGKIYGDAAWPWLHRTAASVDSINVDRVLAEGGGKFHVILLNQIRESQRVRVAFDEKVLGRALDGARVRVHLENKPAGELTLHGNSAEIALPPLGIAVLTLDGVKIDVPTHRLAPPEKLALPKESALRRTAIADTNLEAIGTVLEVPPFAWRDLYVYVTAGLDDCRAAVLRYRVGDGPEQQIKADRFPFEFSARIDEMKSPVTWQVDVQLANGKWSSSPVR